ncbi:hypothetical protein PG993_000813 [Apiospora rasikravindrae]|uniref:Glucose-methanol-choline oxidoreductase N-terminal domain-containing protein n=1 Tax=Apiospora rasikravindrae TaxID=990691 RepID=A0ABR1U9N1_9PEZI
MSIFKLVSLASLLAGYASCSYPASDSGDATYDYVVIGGGTAGLVVAARLSEDPNVSVAVVEAGTRYEISNPMLSELPGFDSYYAGSSPDVIKESIDWGFVTSPQAGAAGREIHYARGKCLGGNSGRNSMLYQRPDKGSLDQWADAVGDQAWTFDNLLPFFKKGVNFTAPGPSRFENATAGFNAQAFDLSEGPLRVSYPNYANPFSTYLPGALDHIGVKVIQDFNSGSILGSQWSANTINSATGLRSSSTVFLDEAQSRPNFKLFYSTMAKKIIFDGQQPTETAVGVVLENDLTLRAKKEVILSAGAFQSPQLLMVSGVGPAEVLRDHNIPVVADRPGVGQNLTDHVFFGPSYRAVVPTIATVFADPAAALLELDEYYGLVPPSPGHGTEGILSNPLLDYLGFEKAPRGTVSNSTAGALSFLPASWPEIEYMSLPSFVGNASGVYTPPGNYVTLVGALAAPQSRGNVTLRSADARDLPVINPNWLTHPADADVAVAAYKRVRAVMASQAMSGALAQPLEEYFPGLDAVKSDAEILQSVRENMMTVYHASATCRMGKPDDITAVVDTHARVYGVKGLRVVDSSAFALLPPGHPQSMVYALAEKISDDIRKGN